LWFEIDYFIIKSDMNGNVEFKEWRPLKEDTTEKISWGDRLIVFLIKNSGGLIKNSRQAALVILIFVIVLILISIYFLAGNFGSHTYPKDIQIKPAFLIRQNVS